MAKSTQELLEEIASEATELRDDGASVKSGIVKKGETTEPDDEIEPEEQVIETEKEEPDEEPEEEEVEDEPDERYARTPNKENALRRIIEKQNRELETSRSKMRELETKVQQFQEAATKSEQKEIGAEISELATELKLDPSGLTKIFDKFSSIVERKFQSKLPPEELYSDYEERQEQAYFNEEWNDSKVQGYLEKEYPRATAKQLSQAKELLDELAHDPDIGGRVVAGKDGKERLVGYPLDYLLMTNKEDFDSILSNKKRHGLESTGRAGYDEEQEDRDTSSAKGIDALDKKYRNAEAESSGLHRVRPSTRSI